MRKLEPKPIRKMKIVRAWLPDTGVFQFFAIFNDGTVQDATKREAVQYAQAFNCKVETIVGAPKEDTWSTTGS